jgi:hypothetical protein
MDESLSQIKQEIISKKTLKYESLLQLHSDGKIINLNTDSSLNTKVLFFDFLNNGIFILTKNTLGEYVFFLGSNYSNSTKLYYNHEDYYQFLGKKIELDRHFDYLHGIVGPAKGVNYYWATLNRNTEDDQFWDPIIADATKAVGDYLDCDYIKSTAKEIYKRKWG